MLKDGARDALFIMLGLVAAIMGLLLMIGLLCPSAGCALENRGRVATVESAVTAGQLETAVVRVEAGIEAAAVRVERTVTDQSQRAVEATQQATVAIQTTDQSTSDRWVNRIAVGCLGVAVMTMAWSSVLRKHLWLRRERGGPGPPPGG